MNFNDDEQKDEEAEEVPISDLVTAAAAAVEAVPPQPPAPLSAVDVHHMYDVPEMKSDDYTFKHVQTPPKSEFYRECCSMAASRLEPIDRDAIVTAAPGDKVDEQKEEEEVSLDDAAAAAATTYLNDLEGDAPLSVRNAWAHAVKRKISALEEEEEDDNQQQQQHQGVLHGHEKPPQPLSAAEINYMYDVPEKKVDEYTFERAGTNIIGHIDDEFRFHLAHGKRFRANGDSSSMYNIFNSVARPVASANVAAPPPPLPPVASTTETVVTASKPQPALVEYGNLACLRAGTFTIPVTSIGSREWERAVTKCAVNYALRQGVEPSNTVELGKMLTELLIHTFIVHGIVVDDVMSTTANRIAIYGIIPVLLLLTVTEKKTHLAYGANYDPEGDKKTARACSDLKQILQERAQFGYALM